MGLGARRPASRHQRAVRGGGAADVVLPRTGIVAGVTNAICAATNTRAANHDARIGTNSSSYDNIPTTGIGNPLEAEMVEFWPVSTNFRLWIFNTRGCAEKISSRLRPRDFRNADAAGAQRPTRRGRSQSTFSTAAPMAPDWLVGLSCPNHRAPLRFPRVPRLHRNSCYHCSRTQVCATFAISRRGDECGNFAPAKTGCDYSIG